MKRCQNWSPDRSWHVAVDGWGYSPFLTRDVDSSGEADGSRSRHGGLKGSKPRGRLRRMGWGRGTGKRCRMALRGLRSGWALLEQFKGLWDGKCLGWFIDASTEGERVKGVSTWRANTPSEGNSPLKGETLPWTASSWGWVRASQAHKGLGHPKWRKIPQKGHLLALVDSRLGLLGGDGSVLLATHQRLVN